MKVKTVENILSKILESSSHYYDLSEYSMFSSQKQLYDYQKSAIERLARVLWKYYANYKADKELWHNEYKKFGLDDDYIVVNSRAAANIYAEAGYPIEVRHNTYRLSIKYVLNRASLWMATGSGKTVVAVVLIDLLLDLIKKGRLPKGDILFLTYTDVLIDQFKSTLDEYNRDRDRKIICENLKRYTEAKHSAREEDRIIFYYRADNISDEKGIERLDYKDLPTNFYLILDEAHKGDNSDSKRKAIFSVLSKDGFLFNMSATFVDEIDHITCAYRYNLADYVQNGYGKNIAIMQSNLEELEHKTDFSDKEKRRVVLKSLMHLALLGKVKTEEANGYYPEPLMLVLGHSVNTEDADIEVFFEQIASIAKRSNIEDIFESVKSELLADLCNMMFPFKESKSFSYEYFSALLNNLTIDDFYKYVFNTSGASDGNIEVIKIRNNDEELLFKHTNADRPFALIKIGNISPWLKDKVSGYFISENYAEEKIFEGIDDEYSHIRILMGSRAFYEGWDTPRPYIVLYINIGKGKDATKFVLQSLGRGVRLVPKEGMRGSLRKNDIEAYKGIQYAEFLETLYIYGTRAQNIKDTTDILKKEEEMVLANHLIEENTSIKVPNDLLILPYYEEGEYVGNVHKFRCSEKELNILRIVMTICSDEWLHVKFGFMPNEIRFLRKYVEDDSMFEITNQDSVRSVETLFSMLRKQLLRWLFPKGFVHYAECIIHYKHLRVKASVLHELENKCAEVIKSKSVIGKSLGNMRLVYAKEHVYNPMFLSAQGYILYGINTDSEREFVDEVLESETLLSQYSFVFGKIHENIDEAYIPYIDENGNVRQFKPDFVFWILDGKTLHIVFVDPKSLEFASAYRKIDGYKKNFEENGKPKVFQYEGYEVKVWLFMYNKQSTVAEEYRQYHITHVKEIFERVVDKSEHNMPQEHMKTAVRCLPKSSMSSSGIDCFWRRIATSSYF
jgi:hypothetical protein